MCLYNEVALGNEVVKSNREKLEVIIGGGGGGYNPVPAPECPPPPKPIYPPPPPPPLPPPPPPPPPPKLDIYKRLNKAFSVLQRFKKKGSRMTQKAVQKTGMATI